MFSWKWVEWTGVGSRIIATHSSITFLRPFTVIMVKWPSQSLTYLISKHCRLNKVCRSFRSIYPKEIFIYQISHFLFFCTIATFKIQETKRTAEFLISELFENCCGKYHRASSWFRVENNKFCNCHFCRHKNLGEIESLQNEEKWKTDAQTYSTVGMENLKSAQIQFRNFSFKKDWTRQRSLLLKQ